MLKSRTPRIVIFGGGTGAPVIIKSLLLAGFSNLSVISVSMDSGGRSGIVRSDERDRVIAISDSLRCLLALIKDSDNHKSQVAAFTDLAAFTDGRRRNLGYTLYYALLEKYQSNFLAVQRHLEQLLGIHFRGTVIPVTVDPTNIHFSTLNGSQYKGEDELDRQSMSANTITKMWLSPPAKATPEAIEAIGHATHIIYAPGSLYGSILANFLPKGITAALKDSKAKKILITNLVSNRNQNHDFSLLDYQQIFKKYTGLVRPIDMAIVPDIDRVQFKSKYPKVHNNYALEHSYFLGWSVQEMSALPLDIKIVRAPLLSITPSLHRVRHNPQELAKVWKKIL